MNVNFSPLGNANLEQSRAVINGDNIPKIVQLTVHPKWNLPPYYAIYARAEPQIDREGNAWLMLVYCRPVGSVEKGKRYWVAAFPTSAIDTLEPRYTDDGEPAGVYPPIPTDKRLHSFYTTDNFASALRVARWQLLS